MDPLIFDVHALSVSREGSGYRIAWSLPSDHSCSVYWSSDLKVFSLLKSGVSNGYFVDELHGDESSAFYMVNPDANP